MINNFIQTIGFAILFTFFIIQNTCGNETSSNKTQNSNSNSELISSDSDNIGNNPTPLSSVKNQPYKPYFPNGNGFFVLYYGDAKTAESLKSFERIKAANPNFVVIGHFDKVKLGGTLDEIEAAHAICVLNGGNAANCAEINTKTPNSTGIRTLYYVPMNCNDDPTLICKEKGLKSGDKLPKDYVKEQIKGVMELGYAGIFFDETSEPQNLSDNNLYKEFADYVHSPIFGGEKLVVVNPGVSDEKICRMFEYADIISVENNWHLKVPKCGEMKIASWRWLSVQGDPADEKGEYAQPPKPNNIKTAIRRLTKFRGENGGFWYYTAGWEAGKPHLWKLPEEDFFKSLEKEAKRQPVN